VHGLTGVIERDLAIPEQRYTFAELQVAQAGGDSNALAGRNRSLLHLHLTHRAAGLGQLRALLD
jgi:glucose-6-phosphate isomerase